MQYRNERTDQARRLITPGIVHRDGSARVQVLDARSNPSLYELAGGSGETDRVRVPDQYIPARPWPPRLQHTERRRKGTWIARSPHHGMQRDCVTHFFYQRGILVKINHDVAPSDAEVRVVGKEWMEELILATDTGNEQNHGWWQSFRSPIPILQLPWRVDLPCALRISGRLSQFIVL